MGRKKGISAEQRRRWALSAVSREDSMVSPNKRVRPHNLSVKDGEAVKNHRVRLFEKSPFQVAGIHGLI